MDQLTTAPVPTGVLPAIEAFHHVGLTVTDIERSEAWYCRVFAFERVMVESHHGGTGYAVVLHRPGTPVFLGLDHHAANAGERFAEHRTGMDHLSFSVSERVELDRWRDHLDTLGIAHSGVNDVAEPFPFATLILRDPDNIQLELTWMAS